MAALLVALILATAVLAVVLALLPAEGYGAWLRYSIRHHRTLRAARAYLRNLEG